MDGIGGIRQNDKSLVYLVHSNFDRVVIGRDSSLFHLLLALSSSACHKDEKGEWSEIIPTTNPARCEYNNGSAPDR